jgi:hypothetical protein
MSPMENLSYEEFWREKEKKYGTAFVYSTIARYLFNYPTSWETTDGLIYFCASVVCFENFKKSNLFYNIFIREEFEKIELEIPMNTIVKATNGYGENHEVKTGFFKRLLKSMNAAKNLLFINTKEENEEKVYAFSLLENPLIFCCKIKQFLINPAEAQ